MRTKTNEQIVNEYVRGVLSGKIVAGKLVRAAVERHVDDLKRAKKKGIVFNKELANRAIDFARCLKHSTGEYDGRPFELAPFQKFIVWSLFGWCRASDGLRRFRRGFISLASGNGKSPLGALLLLLCTGFDSPHEPRAEGYIVATKASQARPVFDEVKRFIRKDKQLKKMFRVLTYNVHIVASGSKIEPLGCEGTVDDGLVPHVVVVDELHRFRDHHRGTLEMIKSKLGKRRQPLFVYITTAGDDTSEVWEAEYELARKVVERGNRIEADDLFVFIAQIDDEDDPFDKRVWPKANPMLAEGVVKIAELRDDVNLARVSPREKQRVVRLRMNRKVSSVHQAISSELWARGNGPLPDLVGRECHAGLDLGWKRDFAAVVYAFPLEHVEVEGTLKCRLAILADTFIPAEGERNLAEEPWASWIQAGHLQVTHGAVTDPEAIYASIEARQRDFGIHTIALDPNNARAVGVHIETTLGIKSFWHGQGFSKMNEPTRELIDMLHQGRLIHGGNPLLAWCALNLVLETNCYGYVRPVKKRSANKIDPIVATIMSVNEILFEEEQQRPVGKVYAI